jgi:ATP-dependent Clp protease ATP-binding subunit ClpA
MDEIAPTQSASLALYLAHQEAKRLDHSISRPEHLLLSLMQDDIGNAGQVLAEFGVKLEEARQVVSEMLQDDPRVSGSSEDMIIHPTRIDTLELAAKVANEKGHNYVRTEHLLWAIIKQKDSQVPSVLEKLGVDLAAFEERINQVLAVPVSQDTDLVPREPGELEDLLTTLEKCKQFFIREADATYSLHLRRIELIVKKHFGKEV